MPQVAKDVIIKLMQEMEIGFTSDQGTNGRDGADRYIEVKV
jgi:hypothetical protein